MENRTTAPEVLEAAMSEIARMNGKILEEHLGEMVRSTVEETLNGLLDAEADHICGAERYERSPDRVDSRIGHYQRKLKTKAGKVKLKVPKLRKLPFESAIIERRRESSVEESLVEMYLAGISVRRVGPGTISNLNKKIYGRIEEWRNRPIEGEHPYVFLDGIWLKMSWGGEVQGVSVLVPIGVNAEGYRDVLGVCLGSREDEESWSTFLRHLKERGLKGVRLVTSDKASGLVGLIGNFFPGVTWQRCVVHFERNVLKDVPTNKAEEVGRMLRAIFSQGSRESALEKAASVVTRQGGDEAAKSRQNA